MQKKDEGKQIEISQSEEERNELLAKADEIKGMQLYIGESGRFGSAEEIRKFALGDIDDPERKHEIYYKGIEKLLRVTLPKGKQAKKVREIIREEKNIFLNRGKKKDDRGIRGSDARMAYIRDMEIALQIISDCMLNGGTAAYLYEAFRAKNFELGYRTSEEV